VASDTLGVSGRRMLEALVAGEVDAAVVADLAKGRLRKKLPELQRALTGRFGAHQRFLVAQQLAHVDDLDAAIAELDAEVEARLRPFAAEVARLDAIPGIGQRTAELLLAEVGADLRRFPTAGHLASWAGMCPGNHESAALVEAAQAAARTRRSYLAAQCRRLTARRGRKRALVAVGHSILVIAYHLLTRPDAVYQDLGPQYFDQRDREHLQRRLVGRLEALGYRVALEAAAA
jgi:transposase